MIQLSNEILIPQIAEQINQGYNVTLPLRGYSMRPFLEDGRDKALLTAVKEPLKVGDVILAEISPKRWALHRIIEIKGENITMYGDGNFSPEYITKQNVIAIATEFYRKGREKPTHVDSKLYTIYWQAWIKLRPIRRYLLLIWKLWHYPCQTMTRIKQKIFK